MQWITQNDQVFAESYYSNISFKRRYMEMTRVVVSVLMGRISPALGLVLSNSQSPKSSKIIIKWGKFLSLQGVYSHKKLCISNGINLYRSEGNGGVVSIRMCGTSKSFLGKVYRGAKVHNVCLRSSCLTHTFLCFIMMFLHVGYSLSYEDQLVAMA